MVKICWSPEGVGQSANICDFFSMCFKGVEPWRVVVMRAGGMRGGNRTLNVHKMNSFFVRKLGLWHSGCAVVCVWEARRLAARGCVCARPRSASHHTYRAARAPPHAHVTRTYTHTCKRTPRNTTCARYLCNLIYLNYIIYFFYSILKTDIIRMDIFFSLQKIFFNLPR